MHMKEEIDDNQIDDVLIAVPHTRQSSTGRPAGQFDAVARPEIRRRRR